MVVIGVGLHTCATRKNEVDSMIRMKNGVIKVQGAITPPSPSPLHFPV